MADPQERPTAEEIVLYEKDPETKIATITLDRADDLNAMTVDAQHRYADLVRLAGLDDDVKVLVIRANGPNLGSGADLPELMEIMARRDDGDQGMRHMLRIPEDADIQYPPKNAYRHGANNLQFYADPDAGMRSLQSFKIPRRFVFITHEQVPRTSTGKVQLFELRNLVEPPPEHA